MNEEMLDIFRDIIWGAKYLQQRREGFPEDALPGLTSGSSVWTYNEDACDIEEQLVVAVVNGVGLVLVFHGESMPSLRAVTECEFGLSKIEAAEIFREEIIHDCGYHGERLESTAGLLRMLSHEEDKRK